MKLSKGTKLLIFGLVLVIIDQIIKILVKTNMTIGEHFSVIGNWFQIYFIENEGMAFGMKFGGQTGKLLLSLFRVVLFGALVYWIHGLLKKKDTPFGVVAGLTAITAGALGNIIAVSPHIGPWLNSCLPPEVMLLSFSERSWICSIFRS